MTSLKVLELSPQNFQHILDTLGPGDTLKAVRNVDGYLYLTLEHVTGGLKEVTQIRNRLVAQLQPEPVHGNPWSSISQIYDPEVHRRRMDRLHRVKGIQRERLDANSSRKMGYEFILAFRGLEEGVKISSNMTTYWIFQVGGDEVWTRENKIPVFYKLEGSTKLIPL